MKHLVFALLIGLLGASHAQEIQKDTPKIRADETVTTGTEIQVDINNLFVINSKPFSLPGLIAKAIQYYPSIKRLHYTKKSAEYGVDSAKWQYFPTPSISASQIKKSTSDVSYSGDKNTILFTLTQPLWAGGRLDANLRKSKSTLSIAKANINIERKKIALKIVNSYGIWYSNYLKKESYKKSNDEHELLHKRIKRRIKQGLSSNNDLKLVNSRLLQVKSRLNSSISRHQSSLVSLSELVGMPLQEKQLVKDFVFISNINKQKDTLISWALSINPILKKIKEESLFAKALLAESRAKFQPQVNLKFQRQWGNLAIQNTGTEDRVFLEVVSDFNAGLSTLSETKKSKALYESSKINVKEEENKIKERVSLDVMLSKSLATQKSLLKSSLADAKDIRDSWYRQFLAGRKQWQDVMNSIREVSQLESQIADAHSEKILTDWRLLLFTYGSNYITAPFMKRTMPSNNYSSETKLLWTPDTGLVVIKKKQDISSQILNFIIPENKEKPTQKKIIWHNDVSNPEQLNPIKTKRSFADVVTEIKTKRVQ